MATYNGGKYIREQMDSILPQLGPYDEVIVSDDGSTDDTIEILESYSDPRIKILHFRQDKSGERAVQLVTNNFENALRHAKGDIIFLSDQDDVWMPDKVSVMTHYLTDLNYDYVESDKHDTDSDLNVIRTNVRQGVKVNKWKSLFGTLYLQGSLCAFKREILDVALPFPKGLQSHDRWLGYISIFKFRFFIPIPQPLILYRRHNASTIVNSRTSIAYKVGERLKYCVMLLKRIVFKR